MKYPYERFLRFLVSRKVDVNRTLERYELPRAGDMWIAECRSNMRATAPYPISKYLDSSDTHLAITDGVIEWATTERFAPLWKMQREFGSIPAPIDVDVAFKTFVNPFSRALLGLLLLSRATDDETIQVMKERFDLEVTDLVLKRYRDLFWDIGLVSRTSWPTYIEQLSSTDERNYISLGITSPSIDEVRDLIGLESSIDHKTILNQIITKSYNQYRKAMDEPQPEGAGAMRWAELAIKAISASKTANFGSQDAPGTVPTDKFRGLFSVQVTKSSHPTLADLAGEVATHEDPSKARGK